MDFYEISLGSDTPDFADHEFPPHLPPFPALIFGWVGVMRIFIKLEISVESDTPDSQMGQIDWPGQLDWPSGRHSFYMM